VEIIDLLQRSEAGETVAMLLRAQVHDQAFTAGPLPKNMAEAARWYGKAAEAGSEQAALALGRMLRDGDGVEADPVAGTKWLRTAAEAGLSEAQFALALAYLGGTGVAPDQAEAVRLLKLAAEGDRGEAIAQLRALKAWDGQ
jgi:TPR repeat protein